MDETLKIDYLNQIKKERIIQKIIDQKDRLTVNFAVKGVNEKDAEDCEGKLIQYYRTHQADGQEFSLNSQQQINYQANNIQQNLNLIDTNLEKIFK